MIKIKITKENGKIFLSLILETDRLKKGVSDAGFQTRAFLSSLKAFFLAKLKLFQLALKVLRADPKTISIKKEGGKNLLSVYWREKPKQKPGPFAGFKGSREKTIKSIAGLTIIALLLQISIFLIPSTKAQQELCPVNTDIVLLMDTSSSMAAGQSPSKCEWTEIKEVPGEGYSTWFLNVKYNVTEQWCQNTRDSFDESSPYYTFKAPTYTPARNSKIVDVKNAANSFLNNLGENDQSALISFKSAGNLDKSLSNDHNEVNNLTTSSYTNIGDAILAAKNELDAGRPAAQTNKIIILLTDGRANKPNDGYGSDVNQDSRDTTYAQEIAQQIANSGYKIYTLGFGNDVNTSLLQNIANLTGGGYYFQPEESDLESIYNEISQIPCGSISGCKYQDANNNGQIDEGEEKLSGWEIVLSDDAGDTQLTDENGCYSFEGLLASNYTVSEGENVGNQPYLLTFPQENSYNITLAKGENRESIDFANYLPLCGNQILDANFGEVCEIGDIQTCSAEAGYNGNQSCNNTCTGWGECVAQENCGDGIKNGNEECDGIEGLLEHYSCSQFCTLEYQPYCGDGARNQPTEECDGEAERPCLTANGYSGQQSCFDCLWSTCHAQEFCGDGIKNGQELCDDGNIQDGDGCSATCQTESQEPAEPVCGNSVLEEGEDCDGNSQTCVISGYNGTKSCSQTCDSWNSCQTNEYCGDNIKNGFEQCDDGNTQNGDGCSSICQVEEKSQPESSVGGGGGSVPVFNLAISTKENKEIQPDTVTVTWFTNTPATSRVIYDTVSHPSLGEPPNYGYAYSTTEDSNKVTFHSVIIGGLTPGTTYFWRAISHSSPEIISDELSFTTEVKGEISLEAIDEQLKEIEGKIEMIREDLEKISPEVPEALAAEELTTEEAEIKGEVTEEVVKEPSTEVIKEEIVGLEEEENALQNKGLLVAIGAMPVNLKVILIIVGVILIGLLILWAIIKRKKRIKS